MASLLRGRRQGLGQTESRHAFIWSFKDTKILERLAVLKLFCVPVPSVIMNISPTYMKSLKSKCHFSFKESIKGEKKTLNLSIIVTLFLPMSRHGFPPRYFPGDVCSHVAKFSNIPLTMSSSEADLGLCCDSTKEFTLKSRVHARFNNNNKKKNCAHLLKIWF